MGHALLEVAKVLDIKSMPERGLPPVLVLLSDGQPTDDFNTGLKTLMDQPWGKKSVRIAHCHRGRRRRGRLQVRWQRGTPTIAGDQCPGIVKRIKWASTMPLKAASNPATRTKDQPDTGHVPIPAPPRDPGPPVTAGFLSC